MRHRFTTRLRRPGRDRSHRSQSRAGLWPEVRYHPACSLETSVPHRSTLLNGHLARRIPFERSVVDPVVHHEKTRRWPMVVFTIGSPGWLFSNDQQSAEEVGFEPTIGLHLFRFSRPALSTTQAPLRTNLWLASRSPGLEELREQSTTVFGQNTSGDFRPVIEPGVRHKSIEAIAGPRLGVFGPIDDTSNPTLNDRPGTHWTRFERDVESITFKPPRAQSASCKSESESFRMSRWIVQRLTQVEGLGKDTSFPRHNGSHRNLAN